MTAAPHDISDLYLAPTLLALDARIDELGGLSADDLAFTVAVSSDTADWTPEMRSDALLRTLGHLINRHGWELDIVGRGLRISHAGRSVVLGLPPSLWEFVGR